MNNLPDHEKQAVIWDYYKPRQTHAWNMLVISHRVLETSSEEDEIAFEDEYLWENCIIRLWMYRTTVRTLAHLDVVSVDAKRIIYDFDRCFEVSGENGLKAIRDMIEHFDDYTAGEGRGPATREGELDPWRTVTRDRFERGRFVIERAIAHNAAITLRSDARRASDTFTSWYKASGT